MGNESSDILVINTVPALIAFVRDALAGKGYRVHTASSMRDALSIIAKESIDLILCGLELEDISGEQFLSYLKRDPLREAIPFIFFLPLESQMELSPKRAIQTGAEDFIFFPLETAIFIARIKKILQTSQSTDRDAPAPAAEALPVSAAPDPAAAEQKGEPDRRSENRKKTQVPIAVEVSRDGRSWSPGLILNHSRSGAMIETALLRKYGETFLIREPGDASGGVASGSVAHVLMGGESGQIGFGAIFHKDAEWPAFAERLVTNSRKQAVESIPPDYYPIAVEVSRDGFFWIGAQIVACDATGAHLQTSILGKPNEEMKVKFERHGLKNIVVGRIRQVALADNELLAEIELDFEKDDGWFPVYAHFAALAGLAPIGRKEGTPLEQTPGAEAAQSGPAESKKWTETVLIQRDDRPAPASQAGAAESPKGRKWTETVLIQRESRPGHPSPDNAAAGPKDERWTSTVLIQKGAHQKPAFQNKRFYQSLVGRKMDNYEVVSFISSGAMGGVFKGWDVALERDVALKVISWELSSQEEFVKMFFKEARFVSKLNHPNISQIYYIGNANGILYYAMEFVHGQTLADLIRKNVRPQAFQVINYLKTACRALDFVWENKIIHRDIKPANIMVTSADEVKIVDFGVAMRDSKGDMQSEKKIVGSPLYLSPETIRNQKVDHRSDIYSLGATFYHLLAGSPPFYDNSFRSILQKQLSEPVPALKPRAPDVPDALCHIIEKMLAKKCDERFQDYQQITERLSAVAVRKRTAPELGKKVYRIKME